MLHNLHYLRIDIDYYSLQVSAQPCRFSYRHRLHFIEFRASIVYPPWKDGVVSIRLQYKILKVIGHRCYCLSAVTTCPGRHDFVIPR